MFKLILVLILSVSSVYADELSNGLGGATITWIRSDTLSVELGDWNTCIIHAPEPTSLGDFSKMAALGYEVSQCFYGKFGQAPSVEKSTGKLPHSQNRETMYVSWVRTNPSQEGGPYCPSATPYGAEIIIGGHVHGCEIVTSADSCEIYVMKPSSENDLDQMARIGHEALHCFIGHFHN